MSHKQEAEIMRLRMELVNAFHRIEDLENQVDATCGDIKQGYIPALTKGSVIFLEALPQARWRVHEWTPDSVFPPIEYPTKRLAAARVLQLLQVGPVAPQTHPEEVCIGSIETEAAG